VSQLEVRYGGRSNAGRGALIGFGLGALSGAIVGYESYRQCTALCVFDPGPGADAVAGALVFGGAGALLGAVIGSVKHGGGWEAVSLGRARVALAPQGTSLTLSLAF
jgi:hypothetical protein